MQKRFLVVVWAGDESMHPSWLQGSQPRNWDLVVDSHASDPQRHAASADGVVCIEGKGLRWQSLFRLLTATQTAWQAYDHVWLADEGLTVSGDEINRLFEVAAGLELHLAQPALSWDSPVGHTLALHNPAFGLRFAGGVDTTAPLFSRALLNKALPSLSGLDGVPALARRWTQWLDHPARQCAIVDRVVVRQLHCPDGVASAFGGRVAPPASTAPDGGSGPIPLCFGGIDADGRLHHLFDAADDAFTHRLCAGWAALPADAAPWLARIRRDHAEARRDFIAAQAQVAALRAPPAAVPAPGRPAVRAAFSLSVGTSLAPGNETRQQRAVDSWLALGLKVLSFNGAAEIAQLAPRYPQVRFVEVARDGRQRSGKPLVYVDDVFAWFRASGLPHGGFINADIVLRPADAAGFLASLAANIDGAMVFSRRIEVDSLERPEGPFYPTGFDLWFWDTRVLAAFDRPTEYLVGFPHWDYYAVLMPLVRGFPIRQFAYPFAYHEKHAAYYDVFRDGIPFGLKTFELVAPHVDGVAARNHLLEPLLQFFLARCPPTATRQEDRDFYFAFLHLLDTWFLDLIDRNSEKIHFASAAAALPDAGLPFLGPKASARPAALAAPAAGALDMSVIIPTHNRAAILARCLEHLAAQTLDPARFEVIVVDDGSTDATAQVIAEARAPARLSFERQTHRGPAAARNRGLQSARGEHVLFLNDDALLAPQALEIHLAEHARRGPRAAVLGSFSMHPDFVRAEGPLAHCLDHSDLVFDYPWMSADRPYDHLHFYTCNLSLRRDFVLAHGGFDEGFVRMGAEDIELGWRLQQQGCAVYYRPDCVALHAHRLDAAGLARMFEFRGRGGVHLFARMTGRAPHYAAMPVKRIDEFLAIDTRLQPALKRLAGAVAALDGLDFRRSADPIAPIDETASGMSFRSVWTWSEADLRQVLEALAQNLERVTTRSSRENAVALEPAVAAMYPALQFIKWYHDTIGVLRSDELPGYLASRETAALPVAA